MSRLTGKESALFNFSQVIKSKELMTSEQAIEKAGLDFTVEKRRLSFLTKKGITDVDSFATVRTDTEQCLGVVGDRYHPVQNREAFSFFDVLVHEGEAIYDRAISIDNGARIALLAKLPNDFFIGKDQVERRVLLYNSHDGSSGLRIKLLSLRLVCTNGMVAADTDIAINIRHTANADIKIGQAHKLLGMVNDRFGSIEKAFNRMALKKISNKELIDFCKKLIPDNKDADSKARTENKRDEIISLHNNVGDAKHHRNTLFGAYNAVTEYVDHHYTGNDSDSILRSNLFGTGNALKEKAFDIAFALVNN